MSRVIKFRVFDTTTHDMYFPGEDGSQLVIGMTHAMDEDVNYMALWSDRGEICRTGQAEFMQFTGLLDMNGQEIYEGDVIEYEWHEGDKRLLLAEWNNVDACYDFGHIRTDYMINYGKVIGNIHDHPELLEVAQ